MLAPSPRRTYLTLIGAVALVLAIANPAAAPPGDLDPTFDGDGKVTTDFAGSSDHASGVAIQGDGKIVAAGSAVVSGTFDFALGRYNTDGSLDTTFDSDGKVTTDVAGGSDLVTGVAIQSDGKIVAVGRAGVSGTTDFALARFNTDGSLDTTFDTDGKVTTDFAGSTDEAYGVAIQSDGKIVAAGSAVVSGTTDLAVARFNTDGSLDTTFDTDGKVTTDFAGSHDLALGVAIQGDGKMVAAGSAGFGGTNDFALARFNTDGSLDTTFDTDGKMTTDFTGAFDQATGVAIQGDGRIVTAGLAVVSAQNDFALARYNTDGSLDTTFSGDGKVNTDFAGGSDQAIGVAIQGDGRIVTAGRASISSNNDFALARYTVSDPGGLTGTTRVSVDTAGTEGNADSANAGGDVSISGDGRFVAFVSSATNLAPGDANGARDIFVRDVVTGTTELVSVATAGTSGNGESNSPYISASGRFVAFLSAASDLVSGDTNGTLDIFLRDRTLGVTERVSVSSSGQEGNSFSTLPAVSPDGRFVTFGSLASNLVTGDTNGVRDIFVRDRSLATTERVSLSTSSTEANGMSQHSRISEDGNLVFFESTATNLVLSDTNGLSDVFVRDRGAGTTERVSLTSSGGQITTCCGASGTTISPDGRFVVFTSRSTDVVPGPSAPQDVYLRDRLAATTERVSLTNSGGIGNNVSNGPLIQGISADGRFVAFNSPATDLVPGDTNAQGDVFVRDRVASTTRRVSISSTGSQSNGPSANGTMSGDGSTVAFSSGATNLVPNDTNGRWDVFVNAVLESQPMADLSITKADSRNRAPTGQNLTYTLTVTNNGPDAASGVTVADQLPPTVTFVSATASQGSCGESGGTVTCTVGAMADGAVVTITILVRVNPPPGTITNTASVSASSTDPNQDNNADSEDTSVCRVTSRRSSIPCP